MRTLAVIGDIHGNEGRLSRVLHFIEQQPRLDGVLLVGDIAPNPAWRRRAAPDELVKMRVAIAGIVRLIEDRLGVPVLFVPGNHDPRDVPLPSHTDRRVGTLAGLTVYGIGGAGPDRFGLPYEWDEAEIRALPVPDVDVLLCHSPPFGTDLDLLMGGERHVGSEAIGALARRARGLLVCGHIHEGAGAVTLGETLCVNVGGLGEPYGRARVAMATFADRGDLREVQVVLTDLEEDTRRSWVHAYRPPAATAQGR